MPPNGEGSLREQGILQSGNNASRLNGERFPYFPTFFWVRGRGSRCFVQFADRIAAVSQYANAVQNAAHKSSGYDLGHLHAKRPNSSSYSCETPTFDSSKNSQTRIVVTPCILLLPRS